MATKGGKIDIHNGIEPATGPNKYSSAMTNTIANTTAKPIHFFFIMHKMRLKNTIF